MMQRVVNYLTCCCSSRKANKGLQGNGAPSDILIGSGHLDSQNARNINATSRAELKEGSIEEKRSLEEEKARFAEEFKNALEKQITIIAIQLVKKSGLACTLAKFQDTYPSSETIVQIDQSLNDCIDHSRFEALRDIVRNGPSDENREAAELLSREIAFELVDKVCEESKTRIVEVFDVENESVGGDSIVEKLPVSNPSVENDNISDDEQLETARRSSKSSTIEDEKVTDDNNPIFAHKVGVEESPE